MSCIRRLSRSRVICAGTKVFNAISGFQSGLLSQVEQNFEVDSAFVAQSSLQTYAQCFFRPLSLGSQGLSLNNETPQNMSSGSKSEKVSWNADVEKYLSALLNETSLTLVYKALKNMTPFQARKLFEVASTATEVPKVTRFLHNLLFQSFLQANQFNEAVEVLEEMKRSGIHINVKSFSTLAYFYLKAGMKTEAEDTLDLAKSFAFTNYQGIFRVLFREYLSMGDEEGIGRLLSRCSDSPSFNSALKVFAEMGKAEETLKLLNIMEAAEINADKVAALLATACLCNAYMIDEAHEHVKKFCEKGFLPSMKMFNFLIRAFMAENRLDEALKLISYMKDIGYKPNANTHQYLISGYLNLGQTDKALLQLEELRVDGFRISPSTIKLFDGILDSKRHAELLSEAEDTCEETVVKAAARILEVCEGKTWSSDIEEAVRQACQGPTSKLVRKVLQKIELINIREFFVWAGKQEAYSNGRNEYRSLIRRYLKAGMLDNAMQSVEDMWDDNVKVLPDDFAHLLYHCGRAGNIATTKEVMQKMKLFGYSPDATLFESALSGFIEAKNDEGITSILQDLTTVDEFNAGISAFVRAGKVDYALGTLKVMEDKSCRANEKTFGLLVRCLCNAKRTEEALEAFGNIEANGLVPDINIFNMLISHCCQEKKMGEALKLFSHMKEIGCQSDTVTDNSLILGYLKSGQAEKAHEHLELMKQEGRPFSHKTSRLFVIHLSNKDELDNALKEFDKTAEEGGKFLSIDACNCLLKGLIKAGMLDKAFKVYEKIKGYADSATFVVMLRGCCNLAKFDLIEQLLAEARIRKIQLPARLYVVLLQTYSRANINKKVVSIFQELQSSGQSIDGPRRNSAVLDGLSRGCQLDMGVKFCNHIVENNEKINIRQVKHFLRLLVRLGRAGEAAELSKELNEKGCVIPEKSEMPTT